MFSFINISPSTDQARWSFQVNADGQSGYNETITSSTWRAYNGASGHAFSTQTDADQANGTAVQQLAYSLGNEAFESVAGELHLYNPSSTTFVTTFKSRTTVNGYEPAAIDWYTTGYINVTGAITQIQFAMTTGNFDGTIKMYGIK